ncbi:hypothetical protein RFI_23107 [Reticulomyxa filosa]|uniref:Uncharacterized protein n=1 Tax=Reticulomyxa filosa TaxID=46433 RepID=X6MKU4_RETFI|nr:hypothetical protein RFI_23107 [Reticulomyxa filosa]|eukprot:ETO14261.1 hypothetical protein RFI_23107 [Reticulomyxa filosa]
MGSAVLGQQNIDNYLQEDRQSKEKVKHLLLLGTGSAGKSTLFNQLKYVRGKPFSIQECITSLQIIRTNCVQTIFTLLKKAEELYEGGNKNCFVDLGNEEIRKMITELHRWWKKTGKEIFDVPEVGSNDTSSNYNSKNNNNNRATRLDSVPSLNEEKVEKINSIPKKLEFAEIFPVSPETKSYDWETIALMSNIMTKLWSLQGIRQCFNERHQFSLPDNMDFYLNKVKDIMSCDYVCTPEDCLKASCRTTGFNEFHYVDENMKGYKFYVYDLGGQRSERRKWIEHFCNVDALIFVAALNHYATRLFEDEKKNAMHESLKKKIDK